VELNWLLAVQLGTNGNKGKIFFVCSQVLAADKFWKPRKDFVCFLIVIIVVVSHIHICGKSRLNRPLVVLVPHDR
jgi:hypothetical protein